MVTHTIRSLNKLTNIGFGIGIILTVLAWLLYLTLSKVFITAVYQGRSISFLNSLVSGQEYHSLDFYIELADVMFLKYLSLFTTAITALFILIKTTIYLISRLKSKGITRTNAAREISLKQFVGNSLVFLFSTAIVMSVWLALHYSFVKNLRGYSERRSPTYETPVFPKLTSYQLLNLGWAHRQTDHPISSYLTFPKDKRPGTIRIGIFGGSSVQGSEIAPGHDFPSFLHNRFKELGYNHVEVINFGVEGYGIHQSYLMWKWLGSLYDLDYVIFFPFKFHLTRDMAFIYEGNYEFIHARFIPDHDSLKLLPVLGNSPLEATELYFRFIPNWRYFRYDAKLASIFRAALPFGDKIPFNPFYWKLPSNRVKEILDTYRLIFSNLAKKAKNVIIVTNDDTVYSLRNNLDLPNLVFLKSNVATSVRLLNLSASHRAPGGHLSAIGNKLRADELFNFLAGESHLNTIQLYRTKDQPTLNSFPKPLYKYANAAIYIEEFPIASFVKHSKDLPSSRFTATNFQENRVFSLLNYEDKFVPLPFILDHGDNAVLSFKLGGQSVRVPFGTVDAVSGIIGRLSIENAKGVIASDTNWTVSKIDDISGREPEVLFAISFQTSSEVADVLLSTKNGDILVGMQEARKKMINVLRKRLLFRRIARKTFYLRPIADRALFLRVLAGQYSPINSLKKKNGQLAIVLTTESGTEERYPLHLSYKIISLPMTLSHQSKHDRSRLLNRATQQ